MPKRAEPAGEASRFEPLPAGRHGLPAEFVAENQRARLIAGIVGAVSQLGYEAATISAISEAAGVSRQTFYDNFKNKEAGFLCAYDAVLGDLEQAMKNAVEPLPDWADRVAASLRTLLGFFATEADLARFFWVQSISAGRGDRRPPPGGDASAAREPDRPQARGSAAAPAL